MLFFGRGWNMACFFLINLFFSWGLGTRLKVGVLFFEFF